MTRGTLLLASLLLAGCAGPMYDGPPFDGTWRATDAELGSMTVVIQGDDAAITAVDGALFQLDGALDEEDGAGELRGTLEVGDPGLQVLFGPRGTNDVEGTINFAMGEAELLFRRRKDEPFIDGSFWRASRPGSTLRTIRLTQVPGKP